MTIPIRQVNSFIMDKGVPKNINPPNTLRVVSFQLDSSHKIGDFEVVK